MRNLITIAVFAMAVSTAFASTQDDATADATPAEKKICRRDVGTGTIMAKRICHTRAEWDQLEAASRANLDRTRDQDNARAMISH